MAKKRADGRYLKIITVKGKKYYVYGKNNKELFENEQKVREDIKRGIERRDNPTVFEYYERWLLGREGTVSKATIRTQDKIIKMLSKIEIDSLSRKFGDIKIKDVRIDDLRAVQNYLWQDRRSQTVNDYMSLVKHIFSDAKLERVIDYNPCDLLRNYKIVEEQARDTKHRALTLAEQKAFFECERCKNSFYYNVFRFAILTGMRIGEIGALKSSDIKKDMIHVQRTVTRTELGNYVIGESAKTKAGRRSIPIGEQLKDVIKEQQRLNKDIDGKVASNDDLVFKASERGILVASPIDRDIKKICKLINIEPFTMHAFRATFATRAIESGMNPKTLQEILGHSNFNITMSLYGHCLDDTKKQEMNNINISI